MRPLAMDPEVPIQGLPRELYDVLVEQGRFDGQRVELTEGEIVEVPPQTWPHSRGVDEIAWALDRALQARHGETFRVRQEKPLAATGVSEPEPDIAVVDSAVLRGGSHPATAHLVIEVAESSRRIDLLHEPRVYAAVRVAQYWVVDLVDRTVVVHTGPSPGELPPTAQCSACRGPPRCPCWT